MENWKAIPGFEGLYEVSDQGRVRSLDRVIETRSRWGGTKLCRLSGRVLKLAQCSGHGRRHLFVLLGKGNSFLVHHLVLMSFVGPRPEGMECRHLDGDGGNNRLDNLAWGTRSENMADRTRLGEHNPPRGRRNHRAKFDEDDVRFIRAEAKRGRSFGQIANEIGASRNSVGKVAMGMTWAWLE